MARKQVEGRASKQAPANRTTYFETLMFHITGNDEAFDFSDICKAFRSYNSGREITAYVERNGFAIRKGISERTKCDPDRNCGMTPNISRRYIGTWKNNDQPITRKDLDKLIRISASVELEAWKEAISF